MNAIENVSRRAFLKGVAATGTFALALQLDPLARLNPFAPVAQAPAAVGPTLSPNLFVSIDTAGTVTIIAHRSEMGQGVRTSVPMILADELEADWSRVKIAQAVGDKKYGNQYTDGSRSIRHNYDRMRQFGAVARTMLEQAAAKKWGVYSAECKGQNHRVVHVPTGRSFGYGELVETAATLPVPDVMAVALKDPKDFRYIGKPMTSVDFPDMVTGKATYGIDVRLPGMKYAVVEHCPVTYGKVKSFDPSEALKVPGVEKVVEIPQTQPPTAIASVKDGKCEVWSSCQDPQAARATVAGAIGMDEANVISNVTLLGGAFGRKSKPDFAAEAAILSRELGLPVRVTWTREDDIQHAYYHTVTAQHIKAGLKDGKVTAWLHRSVFPTIWSTFVKDDPGYGHKIELSLGFLDLPYAIPNVCLENGQAKSHVRIGWLRSVNNIPHAFAQNTMANMLAAAAKRDPYEFLLELIGPDRVVDLSKVDYWNYDQTYEEYPIMTLRLKRVLRVAAEQSGYGTKLGPREGLGLAVHRSFATYVATAVKVKVSSDGKVSIPRVDVAVDAGRLVNPDRVKSQMEGASIYGLTAAAFSEITAAKGRITQSNFNDYPMARMHSSPREIRVHIVDANEFPPGGVGEPGTPPFAPALTNAIFAATGQRIFELPITKSKLTV